MELINYYVTKEPVLLFVVALFETYYNKISCFQIKNYDTRRKY